MWRTRMKRAGAAASVMRSSSVTHHVVVVAVQVRTPRQRPGSAQMSSTQGSNPVAIDNGLMGQ